MSSVLGGRTRPRLPGMPPCRVRIVRAQPSFEKLFFEECAARRMTTLTIAHRAELAVHHTRELVLDGAGGHELRPMSPASRPTAGR